MKLLTRIESFANLIAPSIYKIAAEKGFPEFICGIIIAQAFYESAENTTQLATEYFNFFNLKATSSYKGKKIKFNKDDVYRSYSSVEDGIKGYFEYLSSPRYSNIKKSVSAEDYLEKLEAYGYSVKSFKDIYKLYKDNNLDKYNYKETEKSVEKVTSKPVFKNVEKPVKKETVVSKPDPPEYFQKYTASNSIIGALLAVGCKDTSLEYRHKLANINNIPITPDFNIKLLNLIKEGKLRKK